MIPKAYQIISNKIKKYAIQRQEPTSNLKIDQSTAKSVDVASNAKFPLLSRDCALGKRFFFVIFRNILYLL